MVINLQFFGGRGSSGGLGGSNIKLSPTMARVYYNSAKRILILLCEKHAITI